MDDRPDETSDASRTDPAIADENRDRLAREAAEGLRCASGKRDDFSRWTGGCLCGDCRYEFNGSPLHSGFCHCDMCKKATGGPFAVLVQTVAGNMKWIGKQPAAYRSSPIATRGFCPRCGTPLYLQYDGDPLIRLTVGSLDHPERVAPDGHYGVENRLEWATIGEGLPEEETKERF